MNKYVKEFFHRGLVFGGFGPIILGILYMIISKVENDFSLSATEVFVAIISIYLLAFVQAGATVFNQIEHWPLPKSLLCHFSTLYCAYISCYLLNTWIPFKKEVILIFTGIFIAVYFVVWGIVVVSVKAASKKMNKRL
ncbi:MAG: DUF3021 domain-containing protein [Clostridia bacterium]|nr:DUF3021 domain-containing protein [Clostridia bacterium]